MKKIVVTGASGFVGQHFLQVNKNEYQIIAISLQNKDWQKQTFIGVDAIVHLAGKAHQMEAIDDQIYFEVNTELTKQLIDKAQSDTVPHFVYISSTKVYGDGNYDYLNEKSNCVPTDAYGKSKLAAEQYVLAQSNIKVAIIRPPLVYGVGVKGNMQRIVALVKKKNWLPFGNINNKRSMVYVGNLTALINTIINQQATGLFVAGDATPQSTTQLVQTVAIAANKNIKLIAIPTLLRSLIKRIKPTLYIRLFGDFYVDNTNTNKQLNFTPPFTFQEGINKMVN